MSDKIQTRPFQFGDENEGTWPPRYPSGEKGLFHVDRETGKVREGPPPPRIEKFAQAPYIISDSMEPYRHPMTGQVLESKSALRETDKATGTITTDKPFKPDPAIAKEKREKAKADKAQALRRSLGELRAGVSHLTEEKREQCRRADEALTQKLGWDVSKVLKDKNGKYKPAA